MKNELLKIFNLFVFIIFPLSVLSQPIEQFQQFNGRYDYLAIGNTLNLAENNSGLPDACAILTESSAELNLTPGQTIEAAYLYWAGVGAGDFEVELNGIPLTATRTFESSLGPSLLPVFGAFVDVTSLVQTIGNGIYTLSELDLTDDIGPYCQVNGGGGINFGGWAIILVFQDETLTNNLVSVYDGFVGVGSTNQELLINLQNLNVIATEGAKIGFLAWEGDEFIAVNETVSVNGVQISDPPLNPTNNVFNSTNSFTGSNELWNMDLDFFAIENAVNVGDTSMELQLTSGQDGVIIQNIVVVLASELPDATVVVTNVELYCESRVIDVDFTVFNLESTAELPSATPIAFYANETLIGNAETINEIPIDGFESNTISLTVPVAIAPDFTLTVIVDDIGDGTGIVPEINETNNDFNVDVTLYETPVAFPVSTIIVCDLGDDGYATFFLPTAEIELLSGQTDITVTYYESLFDAENATNEIPNPNAYVNIETPFQTIFVRLENNINSCFATSSFLIEVKERVLITQPEALVGCETFDEDGVGTGNATFDLTALNDEILSGQNPIEYELTYHETVEEAEQSVNPVFNVTSYISTGANIWARVSYRGPNQDLPLNLENCYQIVEIELTVSLVPVFDAFENTYRLCIDASNNAIIEEFGEVSPPVINTGLSAQNYYFIWEINGDIQFGETQGSIVATQSGTYKVTIIDAQSGCETMASTTVEVSSPPLVYSAEVVTPAFAGQHVIIATAEGFGEYIYKLNDGSFQSNNVFEDVSPGSHVITIRDIRGCGTVTVEVIVLDYPLFFTPNNDGYHDTWNIIGISSMPTAKIYIFNRLGKLLKQISPTGPGWDGTYNGKPLPSSDYWFKVVYMEDNIEKQFRGHFTLKR